MIRNSLRLTAVAAALAAATPALATNGMRMIGFGPVQNSMGGVSAAVPLDAATIVTNPAGLAALDARVDLAGTGFSPTVSYTATGQASGRTLDSDRSASYIPTLAMILPAYDKLTVGVAALGVAGMGVDFAQDLYGGKTFTDYMNMRVAPAAAYAITPRLSVGVAANLMFATMKYEAAGGMGLAPRDTAGAFGYGASVGVQYRPVDLVTLGLAYESKSSFEDFSFDVPAQTNVVVGMNPGGQPILMDFAAGQETLDFDQPQVVTAGAAVRPLEGLTLAADVEWIDWTQTNGKDKPQVTSDPNATAAQAWNLGWDDQVVLKLGGEYAATKTVKVRAGYNYGKMPLDASRAFENIAFPAIAEHHFTAGAGYAFSGLTVNAAVMYSPESKLSGGNAGQQIATYETKMSQLAFDLGVSYRF
jgi:long-chain fatty acid transport protein